MNTKKSDYKICAVIAEFNPFHNGHEYLLSQIKKTSENVAVIAIMSGNFVQRGEPAILDKWARTEMALSSGIDLVLELPFVFACNNATEFAYGGIGIAENLGCVDYLAFGIENNDISLLYNIANISADTNPDLNNAIKKYMKSGLSYSTAYINAISQITGISVEEFAKSNNILAIEYLKQLINMKSYIKPISIQRKYAGYHEKDEESGYAGASAIREIVDLSVNDYDMIKSDFFNTQHKKISVEKYLPENSFKIFESGIKFSWNDYFKILRYKILTSDTSYMEKIYGMIEGLENRIDEKILKSGDFKEFLKNISTKRYSLSQIKRILVSILLDFTKEDYQYIKDSGKFSTRVLGFNNIGKEILAKIKETSTDNIHVVTNPIKSIKDNEEDLIIRYDIKTQDILWSPKNEVIYDISDYRKKPVKT